MKNVYLAIVLFLSSLSAIAQADPAAYITQTNEFLNTIFTAADKPIVVAEALDTATLEWMKDPLSIDTLYTRTTLDNWKTVTVDTFVFSEAETRIIDSSLFAMRDFKWTNSLFPDAVIIGQPTVDSLLPRGFDAYQYIKNQYHTDRFHWLSKPIFLRNYTICLFYNETYNIGPLGSGVNLAIYKKVNNIWQKMSALKHS